MYVGGPRSRSVPGHTRGIYRWTSLEPYGDGVLFGDPDNIGDLRIWADDRAVLVGEFGTGQGLDVPPTSWRRGDGFRPV